MSFDGSYTDNELLIRLKNDDEHAFSEVYSRYWKLLFYLAALKLRNADDAKELVQDIFIDFWQRRKELSIEHSIKSYLSAAVKFRIYNQLSKQFRVSRKMAGMPLPDSFVAADAESRMSLHDTKTKIELATAQLPPKCKLVFQLSRDQHLSHKEIADKLGISKKTVDNQIVKALHFLKAAIDSVRLFF